MLMMCPMAEEKPRLGRQVGERLEALRRAHKWSQGQLVIKTGLDKSTVYQILAGARKDPPIGTIMRFADAFGVSLDALVDREPLQLPEPQPEPAQEVNPTDFAALAADVKKLASAVNKLEAARRSESKSPQGRKRPA